MADRGSRPLSGSADDTVAVAMLAAGMGTRLGRPRPKPLVEIAPGTSIMRQQVDNIRQVLGARARVMVVVGFKSDLVMEAFPDLLFAYNEDYDQTNTARSLSKVLRANGPGGLLWMNGDVVFDPQVLSRVMVHVDRDESAVCVDRSVVGEEEVSYTLGPDGLVQRLAKGIPDGLGEAVGINYLAAGDRAAVLRRLAECGDQDYFERGLEVAVARDGVALHPVDVTDLFAVEIDMDADLARVRERFAPTS